MKNQQKTIPEAVDFTQRDQLLQTETVKLQAYLSFIGVDNLAEYKNFEKSLPSLLPNNIEFDKSLDFSQKLCIKISKYSLNYQLLQIEARLGYFKFTRITIINITIQSPTHQLINNNSGGFGTVYECKCNGFNLAFKCFQRLTLQGKFDILFQEVIKEYCILKLASHLRVGPKTYDNIGYDIMIYPQCIEFCMESCLPLSKIPPHKMDSIELDLKQNFKKLHSTQVMHHDIKRDNICFSKEYNRFVFIDYGMGRIIQQKIGFKTLTTQFKGTLDHCSPQMTEFYRNPLNKKIDLYFNDMTGLHLTLTQLQKHRKQQECVSSKQQWKNSDIEDCDDVVDEIQSLHMFILAKCNIFQSNKEFINKLSDFKQKEIQQLFKWTVNIQTSPTKKMFYNHLLLQLFHYKQSYFFDYHENTQEVEQKTSDKLQTKTLLQLNSINNNNCVVSKYFNEYIKEEEELFKMLGIKQNINQLQVEEYLCLLSKVIQINSNQRSLKELDLLCTLAFQRIQQLKFYRESQIIINNDTSIKNFSEVSTFLFRKAFQKQLKGKYFLIFQCIVTNIIAYGLIKTEQIRDYYDKLLNLPLGFQKKTKALIYFHSAIDWLYLTSFGQCIKLEQSLQKIGQDYLDKNEQIYNKRQINILKIIFYKNQVGFFNQTIEEQQLLQIQDCQLKMWSLCKGIKSLSISNVFIEQFEDCLSEISFKKTSLFQYYHFYAMIIFATKKDTPKLTTLMSKCQKTLKKKQGSPFLSLANSIYRYIQSNHTDLQNLILSLNTLKDCQHPIINSIIQDRLSQIINLKSQQLNKLSFGLMVICFDLRAQSVHKIFKDKQSHSLELKYFSAIHGSFNSYMIHKQSNNKMGISFKQSYDLYTKTYSSLRQKLLKQQDHKNNSFLFNSIFLLILLIQKNKFQEALQMAKYLFKLFEFIRSEIINRLMIFEITFAYILNQMFMKNQPHIKDQNRQLYFQYAQMIELNNQQQRYFQKAPIFIDVLLLMYKHKPEKLPSTISRTSKKLLNKCSRSNIQKFLTIFEFIFSQNEDKPFFKKLNVWLYKKLQTKNNPYNIIPIYHIHFRHLNERKKKQHFVKIFSALNFVSIHAKKYILKRFYMFFLGCYWQYMPQRKRMQINKEIVKYNLIRISNKKLVTLLVNPLSLRKHKKYKNQYKLDWIYKQLNLYNSYINQHEDFKELKLRIRYNQIKSKINIDY